MPICFRARCDQPEPESREAAELRGTPLEGAEFSQTLPGEAGTDLALEFDPESIELLSRFKAWAEDPDHFVMVKTPCDFSGPPPRDSEHIVVLREAVVYYAIETHEHGSLSKTYYHLCVTHISKPLERKDHRMSLLVRFFFPGELPTQVRRCCPFGLHFFKAFEWVH